jgi:hypothetical protein
VSESAEGATFQIALARILVEPSVRRRFLADPDAVGRELGLGEAQVDALKGAGLAEIDAFAHSLQSKRLGLLVKVCQATYRLLERRGVLAEVAARFFSEHPPVRSSLYPNRTVRDGVWLIELALRMEEEGAIDCPYLVDVGRFERIMLSLSSFPETVASAEAFEAARAEWPEPAADEILEARPRTGSHTAVESFACAVVEVVGAQARGEALPAAPAPGEGTTVLFAKGAGWRNVRTLALSGRTGRLLALCDGQRTTREIVAVLLRESLYGEEAEALSSVCVGMLRRLYALNVVLFDRAAARPPAGVA